MILEQRGMARSPGESTGRAIWLAIDDRWPRTGSHSMTDRPPVVCWWLRCIGISTFYAYLLFWYFLVPSFYFLYYNLMWDEVLCHVSALKFGKPIPRGHNLTITGILICQSWESQL